MRMGEDGNRWSAGRDKGREGMSDSEQEWKREGRLR